MLDLRGNEIPLNWQLNYLQHIAKTISTEKFSYTHEMEKKKSATPLQLDDHQHRGCDAIVQQ